MINEKMEALKSNTNHTDRTFLENNFIKLIIEI